MWGETLYGLLPIPLQNLAVSLKGHSFHADRYRTAYFTETARRLGQNERLSLPDLKELQFSMFRQFAKHSFEGRRTTSDSGSHMGCIRRIYANPPMSAASRSFRNRICAPALENFLPKQICRN